MKGSTFDRVMRACGAAVQRPDLFLKSVASRNKTPIELELPWTSYTFIEFIESYLKPEHEVFEFGSGGSTFFFAKKVKSVISVEECSEWYDRVQAMVTNKKLQNINLVKSTWNQADGINGTFKSDYVGHLNRSFDVIFVDGVSSDVQLVDGVSVKPSESARIICFDWALSHVKPGGIIVVDDSWRYDDILLSRAFKRREVFKSLGPCRPGVTTTTVYWI